jgi:hypothetical protein
VYRVNALLDHAEASYREALDLARQTSNSAAECKALTDLVQILACGQMMPCGCYRPSGQ